MHQKHIGDFVLDFDLALAFNETEYLTPQIYLMVSSLKNKLPNGTVLHIVTNRHKDNELLQWIQKQVPTKIYFNDGSKTNHLQSRCRYMLNTFQIESDKDWIMKIECDLIFLKHLSEYEKLFKDGLDVIIESENRKIFDDIIAERLWRQMYRNMGYEKPDVRIVFRENDKDGLALFGTGLFFIKNELLNIINEKWIDLTEKCEPWGAYGVHPNEQALTALILNEGWLWEIYPDIYKYNIIGHFRKNPFPDTTLVEPAILPEDVVCLDYHKFNWLSHIAQYNPQVREIVEMNEEHIPKEVWGENYEKYAIGRF